MYDWANSSFATVAIASVLPVYFGLVNQVRGGTEGSSTALWGMANAASMLGVALIAVLVGPMADRMARKKRALAAFAGVGMIATAIIGVVPIHLWWLIAVFYAVSNMGFAGGNIFYDALLPSVASREKLDRVSSGGYALGYLGGGVLLAISVALILLLPPQSITLGNGQTAVRPLFAMQISFVLVGLWWALFSVPLFRNVPEPPAHSANAGQSALLSIKQTILDALKHRELVKFLLAFWLFSDGVGTIIKMAAIYGTEIFGAGGKDVSKHLIGTLLLVQFIGVPFTLLWSKAAKRIGAKYAVLLCLAIYAGICVLGYFMSELWHFYMLGIAVSSVQGGTQALSRSLYARLVPKGQESEFFGFYNISGKFAGIVGPLLFPIMVGLGASSRDAILALIVFFALGGLVLATVKIPPQYQGAEVANPDPTAR